MQMKGKLSIRFSLDGHNFYDIARYAEYTSDILDDMSTYRSWDKLIIEINDMRRNCELEAKRRIEAQRGELREESI